MPPTMALFFSIDDDPKFGLKLCNDETLRDAVVSAMYLDPAAADQEEVDRIVATLQGEEAGLDFEDGWLKLAVGMNEVTEFLMEKVKEAIAEERWSDEQRFKELQRREEAEGRYGLLRKALIEALGDQVPTVLSAA